MLSITSAYFTVSSQLISVNNEEGFLSKHVTRILDLAFLFFHFHTKYYSCAIAKVYTKVQISFYFHPLPCP